MTPPMSTVPSGAQHADQDRRAGAVDAPGVDVVALDVAAEPRVGVRAARATWRGSASVGSVLVNRLGQIAMSTKTVIRPAETQKSGLRRIARQASEASERSSLDVATVVVVGDAHFGDGGFSHG